MSSRITDSVPIQVANRSGFDLSHSHLTSLKVGQITPILMERVLPNDTISCGLLQNLQMPPFATDFVGKVDLRVEAFFVPDRTVWRGYEFFYANGHDNNDPADYPRVKRLPSIDLSLHSGQTEEQIASIRTYRRMLCEKGGLADRLGLHLKYRDNGGFKVDNALPFLAYHRIYNDFYRYNLVNPPLFLPVGAKVGTYTATDSELCVVPECLGWPDRLSSDTRATIIGEGSTPTVTTNPVFPDGKCLFELRQRNYDNDYFVNSTKKPQQGVDSSVFIYDDQFNIAQLRNANALQVFLERQQLSTFDYSQSIKAQFGITPTHLSSKAIRLGGCNFSLYNKSVNNTAGASNTSSSNPFKGQLGCTGSQLRSFGDASIIPAFTAEEYGTIMVMATIVPVSYYETGSNRIFFENQIGSIPFPLLQGIGDQPIYAAEVCDTEGTSVGFEGGIFGYQQRYAHYKLHRNEVSGLLHDGESLSSFALKRGFENPEGGYLTISSDFIEIKQDALDDVCSSEARVSQFGAFGEFAFSEKALRPFSVYSVPTLDPCRDTHSMIIKKGNTKYSK